MPPSSNPETELEVPAGVKTGGAVCRANKEKDERKQETKAAQGAQGAMAEVQKQEGEGPQ